jgi:hypothetical protein
VLAVAFSWVNVLGTRGERHEHRLAWVAAAATSAGLIEWALVVAPMNSVLSAWTPESIPAGWTQVRNRWELGHAVQAVLYLIAFLALAVDLRRAAPSERAPHAQPEV